MERADGEVVVLALVGGDGEGGAEGFDVEPGAEELAEADSLDFDVGVIPFRIGGAGAGGGAGQGLVDAFVEEVVAVRGGEGEKGVLVLELGPEELHDVVDDLAALLRIEAGLGGFGLGGAEALFGEGAEGAGGLGLEDGGATVDDAVGEGGDGEGVGVVEEGDGGFGGGGRGKREWREVEGGEKWGGAAGALVCVPGVGEDDPGGAGGDAVGEGLGVAAVAGGIGAGYAERLLDGPGEERVGGGRDGPGEVVSGEEPEVVEGEATELERAEDLDGSVAGLGRENGLAGDAGELGEGFFGGGAGGVEVKGG